MRKIRGFTLIELLVVVAIIALLIAILMPSLGRAKKSASRTKCLTQLRQIAIGTRTYATANDDLLPEDSGGNYVPGVTGAFIQPLQTTYTASPAATTANTPTAGYGIGRLVAAGFISDMRVAWCPDEKDPSFNMNPTNTPTPLVPWYTGSIHFRSSYDYNPNHTSDSNQAYTKLSQIPNDYQPTPAPLYGGAGPLLALDLIQNAGETGHVDGNSTPMWNVVYADGHAVSVKALNVSNQLDVWFKTGGGVSSNWTRYDAMMKLLLTDIASGQTTQ